MWILAAIAVPLILAAEPTVEKAEKATARALLDRALSQPEVQQAILAATEDPRESRQFGIDLGLGNPGGAFGPGVGVELRYTIIAPITLEAGLSTNAASFTASAEATVNILPIFMNSKWTPIVSVGFSHLRFTGLSHKLSKQIASGTYMSSLYATGGVDYVGPSGFHFSLSVGRSSQIGESGGAAPEEGITMSGWTSWVGMVSLGKMW